MSEENKNSIYKYVPYKEIDVFNNKKEPTSEKRNYDKENIENNTITFTSLAKFNDVYEGDFYGCNNNILEATKYFYEVYLKFDEIIKDDYKGKDLELMSLVKEAYNNKVHIDEDTPFINFFYARRSFFYNKNFRKDFQTSREYEIYLELFDKIQEQVKKIKKVFSNKDFDKEIKDLYEIFLENMIKTYNSLKWVSCFTKENNNTSMWDRYANRNKGICIEYNKYDLKQFNNEYFEFGKVNYTQNKLVINDFLNKLIFMRKKDLIINIQYPFRTPEIYNIYLKERLKEPLKEINKFIVIKEELSKIYFTKETSWNYEREYRIVYTSNTDYEDYITCTFEPKIKAIYLGLKFHEREDAEIEEKDLIEIAKEKGFDIYKMVKSKTEYNLIPVSKFIYSEWKFKKESK